MPEKSIKQLMKEHREKVLKAELRKPQKFKPTMAFTFKEGTNNKPKFYT